MTSTYDKEDAIAGCILGTAVGDALGLPFEGLSSKRRGRLFGPIDGYRFFLGKGMVSDDTEHACITAQSLLESHGECGPFQRVLARRLRWWLLLLPAGIGLATLRACLKLWIGISPERSGVFSAGNGPTMRSPIIGATLGSEDRRLFELVRMSARITHSDPKAFCGAFAAALAAAWAAEHRNPSSFPDCLAECLVEETEAELLLSRIRSASQSADRGESTRTFAEELCLHNGVTGYIYDTVPIALHGWMRHPEDFERSVIGVIECGGDTDSTGALVGALVGARIGRSQIPQDMLRGLIEWPRTVRWMDRLSFDLAKLDSDVEPLSVPRLNPTLVLIRNIVFALIVIFHGFRRLAPPY